MQGENKSQDSSQAFEAFYKEIFEHLRNLLAVSAVLIAGVWTFQHPSFRTIGIDLAMGRVLVIVGTVLACINALHLTRKFVRASSKIWHLPFVIFYISCVLYIISAIVARSN